MSTFQTSCHPLVHHNLLRLRDASTTPGDFRHSARVLSQLMLYEATADLPTQDQEVTTPLETCTVPALGHAVTLVAILRAGLGMLHGMLDLLPDARVGHVGFARNEVTLQPEQYYSKLPPDITATNVVVVDPMLATGGTAVATLHLLKAREPLSLRFVCLVAAPQGVKVLQQAHPDVNIYAGALDRTLTGNGFIVPGLGDAGDRLFGTF